MTKNPLREPSIRIIDIRGGFLVITCDDEVTRLPSERRLITTADALMTFIEEFFDFDFPPGDDEADAE